jgi:hypothetical protein
MNKTDLALYLGALGLLAPHLSSWTIIAILLRLLINASHDDDPT